MQFPEIILNFTKYSNFRRYRRYGPWLYILFFRFWISMYFKKRIFKKMFIWSQTSSRVIRWCSSCPMPNLGGQITHPDKIRKKLSKIRSKFRKTNKNYYILPHPKSRFYKCSYSCLVKFTTSLNYNLFRWKQKKWDTGTSAPKRCEPPLLVATSNAQGKRSERSGRPSKATLSSMRERNWRQVSGKDFFRKHWQ